MNIEELKVRLGEYLLADKQYIIRPSLLKELIDRLQAAESKLEEMNNQDPVGFIDANGDVEIIEGLKGGMLYRDPIPQSNADKVEIDSGKYFVYDPEDGETTYDSYEQAFDAKEALIDQYRDYAADYGWHEASNRIFWGKVIQEIEIYDTGKKMMFEGEETECWAAKWAPENTTKSTI